MTQTAAKTETKKLFVWDGNHKYWDSGLSKYLMDNFNYINLDHRNGFNVFVPVDFDPEKWIEENGKN